MSDHKRAVVTGASSGIGREFAIQLAARGYDVICIARREQKLQALIAELSGDHHEYRVIDLSDLDALEYLSKELFSHHVDVLINNAGSSVLQPFFESELSRQHHIMNTNCGALVALAHAFLKQAKRGDALVNLASIVAYLPTPAQPMYSATKAFIAAFSECLWEEQRERGVYVMGLCPGVTETGFISGATDGESDGQTLPPALIQTTEEVVAQALVALDKRKKAIVVTGWINKLMLQMPRFLTRHRLLKVLSVIGDPDRAL
ncbi:MAG: SDR family NAD(P)-dependent oxidoreductase [Pseudomonadota bacterium]